MSRSRRPHLNPLALAALSLTALSTAVVAQGTTPPRPRPNPAVRALETKAQEARTGYLSQLGELATGYEEAGQTDLAEETLKQILKLNPEDEFTKTKLKTLENKAFEENQRAIEVDVTKGWTTTGLKVTKGQAIRLKAEGQYRFNINADLGPDGFPTQDVLRDLSVGVPCGALIGTVYPEQQQRGRPPQPTTPFTIGKECEVKPDADGVLFVRLNVPPGSKSVGKVKVMVTGNIAPAGAGGN
jgi:hypothetical protein